MDAFKSDEGAVSEIDSSSAAYDQLRARLIEESHTWLVTGVAGFIGSNLLETLLHLGQKVVGLDNFSTGHRRNLAEVQKLVTTEQWKKFHLVEGDIRDISDCRRALVFQSAEKGNALPVEFVLHQAALGSVPRSLADPATTNEVNIAGFLNMLVASRDARVRSFTYAASSSTYGDHPGLPKVEQLIGKPLSPYAVTKFVNELYADVFFRCYGFNTVGLRYFNVFGKRQDPDGAYAAVVPKWTSALLKNEAVFINGDGETSRDFCYIENAVQANLLAATTSNADALNQVYNVAVGDRTTLNALFALLRDNLISHGVDASIRPVYRDFRHGDVRHSQADIGKATRLLGYKPSHTLVQGIPAAVDWYTSNRELQLS